MQVRFFSAVVILFSLLSAQQSKSPGRFSIIENDGVFHVVRSVDGKYASFNELPVNVQNEFITASRSQKSVNSNIATTTALMTTFVVSDAGDAADSDINDGIYSPHTLRSAIENANKLGGAHILLFAPSVTVIQPASSLPSVTVPISIDGTAGSEKVILDGSSTSAGIGLSLSQTSTVKNMVFRSWKSLGLALSFGAVNSVVQRNEFTLNGTGLNINASSTLVGGDNPDDRNTAYGNTQDGISIVYANDNIIKNNFCGTRDGMTPSPNKYTGAYILGVKAKIKNNLFSGNNDAGLEIGEFSSETLVEGNIIGLDSAGRGRLPNVYEGILTFADKDSIINNVISGNSYGITVLGQASQTHIKGNIIGSNKTLDSLFGNRFGGLQILGPGVVIDSNIISCNSGSGMLITGNGGAVIKRNKIGTDPTGTLDWGNSGAGVNIVCDKNTVGGPSLSDRNIISGNGGNGIEMFGSITLSFPGPSLPNYVQGNLIQNNIIGTDINGTAKIPNRNGMMMQGYIDSNFVRDNLISGNQQHGILFRSFGGSPTRNSFTNNAIGTNITRDGTLANDSSGIMIEGAGENTFGGTAETDANTVAYNSFGGIVMRAGKGFAVKRNAIHRNNGLGIDIGNDGPTPNDSIDADTGPNLKQNYPRITWIGRNGSNTKVKGYLQSLPSTVYRLEFYTNDEADTTGFGEGQTFQKTVDVTTNDSGRAAFEIIIDGIFSRVVATATHPQNGTSEFSKAPFVVNSVADRSDANPNDGLAATTGPQVNGIPEVTLRSAIQASFRVDGEDDIAFDIPGSPPHFINPSTSLPVVLGDITIDGSTQPGYDPEAQHAIQLLGNNAGQNVDGLHFAGDRSTVRALYISHFSGDGIEASGDLLTLIDVTSNSNKKSGVHSTGDVTLGGESVFNGNGPAALTSKQCDTRNTAGLWLSGWLRGNGNVTASGNCGPGIRHSAQEYSNESEISIDAAVTANGNSAGGIFSISNIRLKGERFEFSNNGSPKIIGAGIQMGGGNLNIEATGGGDGPLIKMNGNSSDGLYTSLGTVTLKGKSQFNNNGLGRTPLECFNSEISGINAEGSIWSGPIEVIGNGFDGIRTHGSLYVDGNVTVKKQPARGIWATMNILLDGDEHVIEENGDQAMWAANGWITVKGTLTVRNNKYGGTHGVEDGPHEEDSRLGSVQAWKNIVTDDIVIENNEPSGIAGWDNVWIKGNAISKNNAVAGIFAMDGLRIDGADNIISGNGSDGLATNNLGILIPGTILIEGNGKNASIVEEENGGFGAISQTIDIGSAVIRGNARTGLLGHNGVKIHGSGQVIGNGGHGLSSSVSVQISGGRINGNGGYGIASPIVKMSGTQVSQNGFGGISGKLIGSPGLISGIHSRSYSQAIISGTTSTIRGSAITNNNGNGISIESEYPFDIEWSNITGNSGFGVQNSGSGPVYANGNWWGNASGPSGSLSGIITASAWQSSAVGVFAGHTDDSVYVLTGISDSITVVAANWSDPNDSISISASDSRGWLIPVNSAIIAQKDSTPGTLPLVFAVPGGTAAGDTSTVIVSGVSIKTLAAVNDTFYLVTYAPVLFKVEILKDTIDARFGDTLRITAFGFDQKGNAQPFIPHWFATGGSISDSGIFVAGTDSGSFLVRVTDSLSGLHDSVFIRILGPVFPLPPGTIAALSDRIDAGVVNPGEEVMKRLMITNIGGGILRIDSLKTLTHYFSGQAELNVSLLRVGDTLGIEIYFRPDSVLPYHDTLHIYNNSGLSVVKIPLTGNGPAAGITGVSASVPKIYELHQNFPNPFNPATTIRFGVPVTSKVKLTIYDLLGREIGRIADGIYPPGYVNVSWSAPVASGIYFYRIESSGINDPSRAFVQVKRMVFIK